MALAALTPRLSPPLTVTLDRMKTSILLASPGALGGARQDSRSPLSLSESQGLGFLQEVGALAAS